VKGVRDWAVNIVSDYIRITYLGVGDGKDGRVTEERKDDSLPISRCAHLEHIALSRCIITTVVIQQKRC